MFAQPFTTEYNDTINNLGQAHTQLPRPQTSQPLQPAAPSSTQPTADLPAHPIVQQLLLHSSTASLPASSQPTAPLVSLAASASASIAPPQSSDFFSSPTQDRPYFLFCLSCSSPLSDVFHVTDGDDSHVTVDAVYTDSVLSATQPTVLAQQGLFYALSCQRCGSPIGRYYRFTSPGAINKCNMFSLDVQCVGVKLLGSATVKGEQYAEETGIATRLTQVMLTTAAVREEMDGVKVQAESMRVELDRARTRMRRMEQKLRHLMGDEYDDDGDAVEVTAATQSISQTPIPTKTTATTSIASPTASPPTLTPAKQLASTRGGKKRGRPSKAALANVNGRSGQDKQSSVEEAAFVPAVKRKEKAVGSVRGSNGAAEAGRDETEDEMEDGGGKPMQQQRSATNGVKRGGPRKAPLR